MFDKQLLVMADTDQLVAAENKCQYIPKECIDIANFFCTKCPSDAMMSVLCPEIGPWDHCTNDKWVINGAAFQLKGFTTAKLQMSKHGLVKHRSKCALIKQHTLCGC